MLPLKQKIPQLFFPHCGIVQEIIILTLSTMWWEEDPLSTVNITGMIICVAGITTHTTLKAWDTHSKIGIFIHSSFTTVIKKKNPHSIRSLHKISPLSYIEHEKKEVSLPREDHVQLLSPSQQEPDDSSDSDESVVVYSTTHV